MMVQGPAQVVERTRTTGSASPLNIGQSTIARTANNAMQFFAELPAGFSIAERDAYYPRINVNSI
jgi:hypothetical protein